MSVATRLQKMENQMRELEKIINADKETPEIMKKYNDISKEYWDLSVEESKRVNKKEKKTKSPVTKPSREENLKKLQEIQSQIKVEQSKMESFWEKDQTGFLVDRPRNRRTYIGKQERVKKVETKLEKLRSAESKLLSILNKK